MTQPTKMMPNPLLTDLNSIVGPDHAHAPVHQVDFGVDGMFPQAIVSPGTYEEVAAVARYASGRGLAIIPGGHGIGSFAGVGNKPARFDIGLRVARLNQIVHYEPADLTITCQAGATLGELTLALDAASQMLPAGRYPKGVTTVGALLALASSRASNLQYGAERDYTIGLRVVTADGRIIRAGGNVVKNVAGYDLCKLFIGSMGTLGVIVECTLKLVPAPTAKEWIELEFTSFEEACQFASVLRRRGLSLWSANIRRPMDWTEQLRRPVGPCILCMELSGTVSAVSRSSADIVRLAKESGIPHAIPHFEADRLRFSSEAEPPGSEENDYLGAEIRVLPSAFPQLVDVLDTTVPGGEIEMAPLSGVAHVDWLGVRDVHQLIEGLRSAVSSLGGSTIITDCPPELKRQIDVFGDPPPAFDLMRRVKQQFDPNGILSPGRFVGRL